MPENAAFFYLNPPSRFTSGEKSGLVYFKTLQTLFGTRANALRLSVSTPERRLRIVNCGDFCGDLSYILANLATSQINLPQLLNRLNLRGLQSFLSRVQQVT